MAYYLNMLYAEICWPMRETRHHHISRAHLGPMKYGAAGKCEAYSNKLGQLNTRIYHIGLNRPLGAVAWHQGSASNG